MLDETFYQSGYSIGVGGVVLCGNKVLLVRSVQGEAKDEWAIPGGFIEHRETIDVAVQREVFEEAGVKAEIDGLIAARNRVTGGENSAYFVFLSHASTEEAQADGVEVNEARYFTLAEVETLPRLRALSRMLAIRALEGKIQVLTFHPHPSFSPTEYMLFL
jgi:8-oxo-dGTP diphosphatase